MRRMPPCSKAHPARAAQAGIGGIGHAMDKGDVMAVDAVIFELLGQPVMGAIGFRHDQQARRILVDAVDDAGAFFATDARERVAAMMQQRIDQRAGGRAGGGVDDHACGFVDDDQIGILVEDRQGDGFGLGVVILGRGEGEGVFLAFLHARLGVGDGGTVLPHVAFGDHLHQARAGECGFLWHLARQGLIQTVGRIFPYGHGQGGCALFGKVLHG
jgi:hypothetical protein